MSSSLSYEPKPRRRGWRLRRRWVYAALALTFITCIWLVLPKVSRQMSYLRLQRQFLDHIEAPDRVAYQEDTAETLKLDLSKDYIRFVQSPPREGFPYPIGYTPPKLWQAGINGIAIAFLGERRNGVGESRLIVANLSVKSVNDAQSMEREVRLNVRAYEPASLWPGSRPQLKETNIIDFPPLAPADRIRFFAGQRDSKDASHFTIAVERNGKHAVVDANVTQGKIKLELIPGKDWYEELGRPPPTSSTSEGLKGEGDGEWMER